MSTTTTLGRFGQAGFLRGKWGSNLLLSVAGALRTGQGLSTHGAEAFTAAVEALIPAGAGAVDPPAVVYRAQEQLYAMAPSDRRDLCTFLELLERLVPIISGAGLRFSRLPRSGRARCLAACENSPLEALATGHAALRHLALLAYLETPEATL